jgi:hypothetical protein
MSSRVSAADLNLLLSEQMEVGISSRRPAGPSTPGSGFSSASPHFGGTEQGTFPGISGGVAASAALDSSIVLSLESGMEQAALDDKSGLLDQTEAQVRLLWTNRSFIDASCCGLIGKAGEKFCTRRRVGADLTCGIQAHARKADVKLEFIYFWETSKNVAFMVPSLDSRELLAAAVWEMRTEEITRVEFKALFQAVVDGDASNESELAVIKGRILSPSSGVGFTPRKKPRYSDSSWDFAELDILPPLEEGPGMQDKEALSSHILEQWKGTVQTVEVLKKAASRNNRYEREMESLGNDIDSLRSAMARVNDLVGSPSDGVAFDLFAIVDGNEEALLDLDSIVQTTVVPKLTELEGRTSAAELEMRKFKANTGNDLQVRLASLESQIRAVESSSTPEALEGIVLQMRSALMKDIIPAIRHLWKLFELTTVGKDGFCEPTGSHATGEALLKRLDGIEATGRNLVARLGLVEESGTASGFPSGIGGSSLIGLSQRLAQVEKQMGGGTPGPTTGLGSLPSVFGRQGPAPFTAGLGGVGRPGAAGADPGMHPDQSPRLTTLEAKVRDLESQMDNVSVSMGGNTFKSVNDCESFILQHIPGNTYAHFYDVVSLLQRAWGHNHVGVREAWDKTYALKKAGFSSQGEAVILASMDTVLPSCLGELKGNNSECQLPLPALATHENWTSKGYQMGRRRDIQDGII